MKKSTQNVCFFVKYYSVDNNYWNAKAEILHRKLGSSIIKLQLFIQKLWRFPTTFRNKVRNYTSENYMYKSYYNKIKYQYCAELEISVLFGIS